jgi:iron-sulfur cluster repair protein YtfE (RIC family)
MQRHNCIIKLSRDHHQGLILAQLIKKNAPSYSNLPNTPEGKIEYTLNAYKTDLLPHFQKEEEILFPFINGKNKKIDQLINNLLGEHKKISGLVNKLGNESNNKKEILDELGNLLTIHIRKEERELFAIVQDILSEEELIKLENLFD